jgi:hypothetical protein
LVKTRLAFFSPSATEFKELIEWARLELIMINGIYDYYRFNA